MILFRKNDLHTKMVESVGHQNDWIFAPIHSEISFLYYHLISLILCYLRLEYKPSESQSEFIMFEPSSSLNAINENYSEKKIEYKAFTQYDDVMNMSDADISSQYMTSNDRKSQQWKNINNSNHDVNDILFVIVIVTCITYNNNQNSTFTRTI